LFQLVDTPPLSIGSRALNNRVAGLIRNADAVVVVVDASSDPVEQYRFVVEELEDHGILLSRPRGRVVIEKTRMGKSGVRVVLMGRLLDCTVDDIRRLLESYRIYSALVKVYGEVSIDDVEQAIFESRLYKPSIVIINKADLDYSGAVRAAKEIHLVSPDTPIIVASARLGKGFSDLGRLLFRELGIIRVYTKQPNGEVSDKPLILRKGSTVYDVAIRIHRSFVENFLYAKIWGPSAKYPGERVGLDHVVADKDVVEIHIRG